MNIILHDYESVWPDIWPQNKCRSLDLYFMVHWCCLISWSLFDIWTPYFWDYESVWPDVRPKNNCMSLWPIFHGPVILPYILKTVCCMNIILQDYESVWPDIWPKNKCRSLWLYFMVQWFCLISWRLFDVWTLYFVIMSQCNAAFALKQCRS